MPQRTRGKFFQPAYVPSFEKTSTSHKLRLPSTPTNWMATNCPIKGRAHENVFVVPSSVERFKKETKRIIKSTLKFI